MSHTRKIYTILTALALVAVAQSVVAQGVLRRTQSPQRAWLGLSFSTEIVRVDGMTRETLVIHEIVGNSPAQRGGLEAGDQIIAINDIRATNQLMSSLGSSLQPGDEVNIRVLRDGREREFTVRAGEVPNEYRARLVTPRGDAFFLDTAAVSGRIRLYLDSARRQLEVTPRIWADSMFDFEKRQFFFSDSLFVTPRGDSAFFWSGPRGEGAWRMFGPDSAWGGMYIGPRAFRFRMDSIMRFDLDSLHVRMQPFAAPGFEMRFDTLFRGPGEFGIAILGSRAIAGAELTELNPDLGAYFGADRGVLVVRVPDDTPADRAGLEAGDVITAVNGRSVSSVRDLRREIGRASSETVRLEIVRKNARRTIDLRQ